MARSRVTTQRRVRRRQWYGDILSTPTLITKGMSNAVNIGPLCVGTTTPGLELDAMTKPTLVRVRGTIILTSSAAEGSGATAAANFNVFMALWVGPAPAAGFEIDSVQLQNSDRIIWAAATGRSHAGTFVLGGGEAHAAVTPNETEVVNVDSQAMRVLGDDERLYLSIAATGESTSSNVALRYFLRALYLE